MTQWKRSRAVYLVLEDETVFRLQDLFQGRVDPVSRGQLFLFDLVQGQRLAINQPQLDLLMAFSADRWVADNELELSPVEKDHLGALVQAGALLTNGDSVQETRGRQIDQALDEELWHPDALFFHRMSRLRPDSATGAFPTIGIGDVAAESESRAQAFIERHGAPPSATTNLNSALSSVPLPAAEANGGLIDLLRQRKTTRAFDSQRQLPVKKLSTILKYTFGRLGQVDLAPKFQLLKKGSPSGGGLHPIEAFPLIRHVEGLAPGLYHYDVASHHLSMMLDLPGEGEVEDILLRTGAGQSYMAEAHFAVLLVARFRRNHWKYRRQSRTYSVMLMDAGHLSQTFYLLATQLGLGAFFSAALDTSLVEDLLALPPEAYGPLGVCGCGYIREDSDVPHGGSLPFNLTEDDAEAMTSSS